MAGQRVLNRRGGRARGGVLSPHKRTHYLCFDLLAEHTRRKGKHRQQNRAAKSHHRPVRGIREAVPTAFRHLRSFSSLKIASANWQNDQCSLRSSSRCARGHRMPKEALTAKMQNALRGVLANCPSTCSANGAGRKNVAEHG